MKPEYDLKHYYLEFITTGKENVEKYRTLLEKANKELDELKTELEENKQVYAKKFGLDLNYYESFTFKIYNNNLYRDTIKLFHKALEEDKKDLLQLLRYCKLIEDINKYKKLININLKRDSIKYNEYRKLISNYYCQVHKEILKGNAYKYGNGFGTFTINYYRIPNRTHNTIDFAATNARKKELLAKGIKLYDDKEAAWYKARGIPYDGVDYRVYMNKNHMYDFVLNNNSEVSNNLIAFERTEYVHAKYRGLSYTQIADKYCTDLDSICQLNVDLRYKLNIYLYLDPNVYLNFIRNEERLKYKHRSINS